MEKKTQGYARSRHIVPWIVFLLVVALTFVAWGMWCLHPKMEADKAEEEYTEFLDDNKFQVKMGETAALDPDAIKQASGFDSELVDYMFRWKGELDVTIESADYYKSPEDAGISVKDTDVDMDFKDYSGFLLCKVRIDNVNCTFAQDEILGDFNLLLTFIDTDAGEIAYIACDDKDALNPSKNEYAKIPQGSSATFMLGWEILEGPDGACPTYLRYGQEEFATCELDRLIDHTK